MSKLKEGAKYDSGKLRYDLLPVKALREIVKIFTHGAAKYEDRNWERGIKFSRCYGALQRHLNAWWGREENDNETGITHLAHAGCCLLFLLHYIMFYKIYKKFDNRPIYKEENSK